MTKQKQDKNNQPATHGDLRTLGNELRGELHGIRDELRGEMHGIRDELRGEMHGIRDELRGEMHGIRDELRGEMHGIRDELRSDIRALDAKTERTADFLARELLATRQVLGRKIDNQHLMMVRMEHELHDLVTVMKEGIKPVQDQHSVALASHEQRIAKLEGKR